MPFFLYMYIFYHEWHASKAPIVWTLEKPSISWEEKAAQYKVQALFLFFLPLSYLLLLGKNITVAVVAAVKATRLLLF